MEEVVMKKFGIWKAGFLAALALAILMCVPAMAATKLGETEEAYWDKGGAAIARWKTVDKAKEYQVRLFEDGDTHVKTVTVSSAKADLSSYMQDGHWYYFEVRAVPKSGQKSYTSGEWVESDEYEAKGLGDTQGKWRTYSQGKKYQKADQSYGANEWYLVQGNWYYFNEEGYVLTGWQQISGKWYFFSSEGIMQTGWLEDGGSRYFLDSDGSMATGWKQVYPGQWYYMDDQGKMVSGTEVDGYRLNETGLWVP
jgi:hypothetical protein